MLPVSGSATAPVRPLVVETPMISASQVAEVGVGSTSELNTVLLKQLMSALTSTDSNNQLEDVRNVLKQHGLDDGDADLLKSKVGTALADIEAANDKVGTLARDDEATVAKMISAQYEQVDKTAAALGTIKDELEPNRIKAKRSENQLNATIQTSLHEIAEAEEAAKARTGDNEISVHTSYSKLWAVMAEAIKNIRTNYVDFYAGLMQKYTEMYEAYNEYVQKASADAVKAGEDGNNVDFTNSTMKGGYDKFDSAVKGLDLGSVDNWDKMTDAQKASMTATLEPAFKVDQSSGKISFNLDQYNGRPYYPSDGGGKVSTSSYQAWLASFNAIGTGLQSNMQSFAQRYTQANSTFDNLNKVLSGAISSMADSAKDVLKALG
ncbi:IpaD/SipD/SspD family type III secretion system needle tip protein [Pantoea ananatis]|uniref:IpaD/SipD/SspD family type III secretion system needle tip protein n=1 Tax=Pantoea ananas TaxID=553 RepID=UPI00158873A1|nr:IpaD/SipD/SspD family type III secretion system needle tip protein [Pantoea ananatis]MBA4823757.1 IpaD/SipD/SspD family type III secretion system needle tip protein [Pantoea ananatis]QKV85999.1 IpaD/SipD/SspD family type III secretion system needle tip protein [Pantoea ananatis]